jgi:hypothetical protein
VPTSASIDMSSDATRPRVSNASRRRTCVQECEQ